MKLNITAFHKIYLEICTLWEQMSSLL